jgi:hypothetical protein
MEFSEKPFHQIAVKHKKTQTGSRNTRKVEIFSPTPRKRKAASAMRPVRAKSLQG